MSRHQIVRTLALAAVSLTLWTGMAFAEPGTGGGVNPGERIGTWVYQNVTALFAPLLAAVSLYYLAKRQFTQFLSFAVFAVIVALFVYGGTEFKDAAVSLAKWVIGK